MINIAYAMGTQGGGGQPGAGAGGFASLVPLILMFVIFYFLLIRPQQKKAKEHREMISNLKRGDRIVTNGGIYGRIENLDENTITLEVANNVKIKIGRGYVSTLVQSSGQTNRPKDEKSKPGEIKPKK